MRRIVRVHIRELVLEGVAPGERYRVGEAVRAELERLLGERGPALSLASRDDVDAGSFQVGDGRRIGAQVARAVYGGLRS